jgi:fimbrial chaperone protein
MATRLATLAVAATALLASAVAARAAEVQISPVVVSLSSGTRSAIVSVRNAGRETARFELQARSWEQSPSGEMILGTTSDLAVYPPVLSLAPGEARNVRIGAIAPFGPVEKTYRVFLQEMAPPETPEGAAVVRVLSRIGLPIFLSPAKAVERTRLVDLAARSGKVTFRLVNEGTVHVRPTSVKLVALGAGGKAVFETELSAWYVLPGGERTYEAAIPPEACGAVQELEVSAALPRDVIRARLATPDACAP